MTFKNQFLLQKSHRIFITKVSRLSFLKEIIAVCYKNHMKPIKHSVRENEPLLVLQQVVHMVTTVLYRVNDLCGVC
jgi:hypothetical protein